MKTALKIIANIIWLIFTGVESAICWGFLGAIWCVTIIGIPFGLQCFKFARLSAWPFGAKVKTRFLSHPIANVIWFIFGGLEMAIIFGFIGLIWCITIIGIPFGKQCFKLAKLALMPFGAGIEY